ncbi:MAG: hypothetical protein MI924_02770 [Chloroflexales bacterium]|nr:hypothetical protein [Chloroflexales bacterium]
MSYRYRARRHGERISCLRLIALLGVTLVLLIALYAVLLRPWVSSFVGQEIARGLGTSGQVGVLLPTVIAALPAGEVVITDAQANAYLAANPDMIAPLDSARIRFVPGEVQIDMDAFGSQSQVRAGLTVQEGRLVITDPHLDGPLGLALSGGDILHSVEQQLNDHLANQAQTISAVRIEQGQMFITVE